MFYGSEKEYEILKTEAAEIRACINRYIGYLISVAGITSVSLKFFLEKGPVDKDGEMILNPDFYFDCTLWTSSFCTINFFKYGSLCQKK